MSLKCGTRTTEPIMNEHEKAPSLSPALFRSDKLHSSMCVCVLHVNYTMKNVKRKGDRDRDIQNEE